MYVIFLIPIILIIIGLILVKCPPKKINIIVGYRTRKSMKNENNWKSANQYCGRLWIIVGIIMFLISLVVFVLEVINIISITETLITIFVLLQTFILLLTPFVIERKIK